MAARGRPRSFDRDTVLRAAMLAFWEQGYEGTSINDLSAGMGINPPSLYATFGSKEQLFRAAVEHYGRHEGSIAARALAAEPTARGAVETMLRECADRYTDPALPRGCMVVLSATTCTTEHESVRELTADHRRRDEQALRERLERAVGEGELPADTDPARLAAFVHTVLYGMAVQARDGASRADLHAVVDQALAVWK